MKHILALLLAACAITAHGQTIKSLGYNTTNSTVIGPTSGVLLFTNDANFPTVAAGTVEVGSQLFVGDAATLVFDGEGAENWRSALGLGATWLTNDNVTNFRTAIGLGATNDATFNALSISDRIVIGSTLAGIQSGTVIEGDSGIALLASNGVTAFVRASTFRLLKPLDFSSNSVADTTRTNLGLGGSNIVTFAGLTNNGDITINQTTTNNGLLYIRRTNNEAFLGLANLIASNNTTISNETLFRVGVSEATNKAAQFGFRSTNTNGNGVAVFSLFGYNALMMVGADASTNAVIYSGGGTNNEVMTLIRDGATEFARPIRFSTNAATKPATNAPTDTTNAAAWVEMRIGTNSYRVPLYQ
jgi:hypothetical protein